MEESIPCWNRGLLDFLILSYYVLVIVPLWLMCHSEMIPVGPIGLSLPIQVEFLKPRSKSKTYHCLYFKRAN